MDLRPLLKLALLNKSISKDIDEAVNEWEEVSAFHEEYSDTCICGKENIKYCFEIRNVNNNELLYPIGSECIKHFGNKNLLDQMKIYQHKNFIFNNKGGKNDGKTFDWICKNDENYIQFLISMRTNKKRYERLTTYYLTTKKSIKFIPPIRNVCDRAYDAHDESNNESDDSDDNSICQQCHCDKPDNQYKLCYNCNMNNKTNKCSKCSEPTKYKLCWNCHSNT
tara:strand:+ start:405 stop:1073 length:669 start_codon:yes stop_codon:yes gene_type:complete